MGRSIMARFTSTVVLLWFAATGVGLGFERPKILLSHPHGTDRFGNPQILGDGSSILVKGEVKPPVGNEVTVSFNYVKDDGSLRRDFSATTPVRNGKFAIDFNPPTKGWTTGRLRVEVVLGNMKQVKASVDLTIDPLEILRPSNKKVLKESGITVDLEKVRGTTLRVPAGTLFYVRGNFEREGVADRFEGPTISAEIYVDQPGAKIPRHTIFSGSSLSLRETEDKPVFEYEVSLEAPERPGIYRVWVATEAGKFLLDTNAE
jgi:hypothetical protein